MPESEKESEDIEHKEKPEDFGHESSEESDDFGHELNEDSGDAESDDHRCMTDEKHKWTGETKKGSKSPVATVRSHQACLAKTNMFTGQIGKTPWNPSIIIIP